jgi:hypothetical protein
MLSLIGLIDGITAVGVVLTGIIFGVYFILKSKKSNANLLLFLGIIIMLAGLAFLGVFLDFLVVVSTGKNIINPYGLVGILSYIWIAPLIVIGMYIGAELLVPEKKKLLTIIYLGLMIIFEIIIFLDPLNSFNFVYPAKSGEALIDYNLSFMSAAGLLMLIFLASMIIFLGFGFLIKALQSTGIIRNKFFLLSIGIFFYSIFGALESLTTPGIALILIRIGYISGPIIMYYGLKT